MLQNFSRDPTSLNIYISRVEFSRGRRDFLLFQDLCFQTISFIDNEDHRVLELINRSFDTIFAPKETLTGFIHERKDL